jgi:NADPH2 dehydrogenase
MSSSSATKLAKPLKVGNVLLQHRIGMCPLTRFRATESHTPTENMTEYYQQRSSVPGTLLVTEATFISREDGGYERAPGIFTDEHISAWRKVTDAVHANRSFIYCQLWSLGRTASPETAAKEGYDVAGPDTIPMVPGKNSPRRLSEEEVQQRVRNFAQAAKNAVAAGFDGVEIHGANGYMVDQFLQASSNGRDDKYGGSVENRSRFGVEVAAAVVDAIGASRTGIRLSPWSKFQGMGLEDPVPQFSDLIRKLAGLDLAYLHLVEARVAGSGDAEDVAGQIPPTLDFAFDLWKNPLLIAGGLEPDLARELVDEKYPDKEIVAMFGRYFISSPDLPIRVLNGIPVNAYDRTTFYSHGTEGYVDYPFSQEFLEQKQKGFANI